MSGRLFLALWPDEAARAQIAAWRDAANWSGSARRTHPQDWHLTLHFLGELDDAQRARLLRSIDVPLSPFDLALDHGQTWRNGVASLVPAQPPAPLLAF